MSVRQLRLVVTAADYDVALAFYRDVLGLEELGPFTGDHGAVTILDAGRATLELSDPAHADHIDEVEVGRRVAGHVRVAFEVDDVDWSRGVSTLPVRQCSRSPSRRPGDRGTHGWRRLPAFS